MSFSRRQFIQLSAGAALSAALVPHAARAASAGGDTPLPVRRYWNLAAVSRCF